MTRVTVGLLVVVMLSALPVAAWAQEATESAPVAAVVLMPQWYELDEFGNQNWLREYDGREFDLVDISEFLLTGLTDDALYEILLSHPIAGDAEAAILVDQSYWLNFDAMFNSLTHRFADDRNALVVNGVPTFENRVPWSPGDPRPPASTDVLNRLTTDEHMMERNEWTIGVGFTPAWMGNLRLTGAVWHEQEQGEQIFAFRDQMSTSADRRKVLLTAPVDRDTTESEIGFDGGGGGVAYAYRHSRREFASIGPPDLTADHEIPAGGLVTPNNRTDTNEAEARLSVGENAWLTAGWIDRNRRNEFSGGTADLRTLTANFAYRPSRNLHITARWRDTDQDLNITGPDSGLTVTSRDYSVTSVEARYYGMSRTVVRGSWARREVDRSGDRVTDGEVVGSTTTDTLKLGLTHRPMSGMTLRLDWRKDDTDHPAIDFIDIDEQPPRPVTVPAQSLLPHGGGLAADSDLLNASLTYAPTGNYNLYADYRRLKEDRNEVNYHNEDKQWLVGGWAALSDRWSVHAEASRIRGDNGINWVVYGRTTDPMGTPDDPTDDVPQDLPWPRPEHVVYDYNSRVYSAGLTYAASPKLRLFSNWYRTTADGVLAPSDWDEFTGPDVIDGVSPLDVTVRKYSVGVAWTVDPSTTLIAELGRERWADHIDTAQSGSAEFITLSLRKRM